MPAHVPASSRIQDPAEVSPVGIALVRVLILLATAILAVVVALPAVLDLAAAPFR